MTSSIRLVMTPPPGRRSRVRRQQGLDAGQRLALDELERGAAAGADVGHLVGQPELLDRRHGVAAADDGDHAASAVRAAT